MRSGLVLFVLPGVVGRSSHDADRPQFEHRHAPSPRRINHPSRLALAAGHRIDRGRRHFGIVHAHVEGFPTSWDEPPEGVENIKGKLIKTLVGTLIAIPIIAQMVQRTEISRYFLFTAGSLAFGYMIREAAKATKIERDRMKVIFVLIFFLMIFWSFFDQGGSSINLFTDRNVDRVQEAKVVEADAVGTTIQDLTLTQEQLGYTVSGEVITIEVVEARGNWLDTKS